MQNNNNVGDGLMEYFYYVGLIGLLSGIVGTAGGGIAVVFIKKIRISLLSIVLGISSGIMSVVIFFDLFSEAFKVGSIWTGLVGTLIGVIVIGSLDFIFPHQHFDSLEDGKAKYLKTGLLLAIGIALHNFPEGLAIGAGYSSTESLGLGLAVIMAIQNFPEGMAVATTLGLANIKNMNIIIITFLSGIPMGLGALVGAYWGSISKFALSLSLGFAAGAMLYITFDELLPEAHNISEGHQAIVGIMVGIFLGIILTKIL
jgi:ZIP family zinc transporter